MVEGKQPTKSNQQERRRLLLYYCYIYSGNGTNYLDIGRHIAVKGSRLAASSEVRISYNTRGSLMTYIELS